MEKKKKTRKEKDRQIGKEKKNYNKSTLTWGAVAI